jgi:hypothetical protein
MTNNQEQTRQEAIEKMRSLKADFEAVASDTRQDKFLWVRKLPKNFMARSFEDYAFAVGEMIDTLAASKKVEVYPDSYGFIKGKNPLECIGNGVSRSIAAFAKGANRSPKNKKAADLYRELTAKIDEIMPLLKQIPSTVMVEKKSSTRCRI